MIEKERELLQKVFEIISEAFEKKDSTKIFVDGEEDLITLAVITTAPNGTLVVYGQPGEGMVFVEVDDDIKDKVNNFLEEMV